MRDDEISKGLNDPEYAGDRSEGVWRFINTARRRGHTPNEIVQMMVDHSDALLMQHYAGNEKRIRDDVERAVKKMPAEQSASEMLNAVLASEDVQEIALDNVDTVLAAMNKKFAVVKYGSEVAITMFGDKLEFMGVDSFHRMFANKRVTVEQEDGSAKIPVSKLWFTWERRREYLSPGVDFKPGAPLEAPGFLNLWRSFGVQHKRGDWPLLRDHIVNVICAGNQDRADYLIKWMAYGVQHPDKPAGVAVALRGQQGAGKGILCRTYGELFGNHFAHITNPEQLIGRFNALIATSIVVFLDEALWAGDRKGEGTLKALITEPEIALERKGRDPIMVKNCARIMISSNEDWFVPVGIGDRRFFVLDVPSTYAGTRHKAYWDALYSEVENGGREAMLHDLLHMDLTNFNVRAVPDTPAKTEQKLRRLRGTDAWLSHILHEGAIGHFGWEDNGLTVGTDPAYNDYVKFSERRREWAPEMKDVWAKMLHKALGEWIANTRLTENSRRVQSLRFGALEHCRIAFQAYIGAEGIVWE
jgi:hypothetical protein